MMICFVVFNADEFLPFPGGPKFLMVSMFFVCGGCRAKMKKNSLENSDVERKSHMEVEGNMIFQLGDF